jgi:hypothetical protein
MSAPAPDTEHDTLYGLSSVARFAGVSQTEAKRLIGIGELPTFDIGTIICGSKARLREWRVSRERNAGGAQ